MVVDHHEGPGGWDMKRAMKFFLLACASVGVAAACTPPTTGTPGGTTDTIAPQVISVDVIPNEVQPGQQFTISATVTDAVGVTSVAFVVRANNLPVGWCGGNATRVGGTAQTGQWERTCTAPTLVNAGSYQVNTLALDARNNPRVIGDGPPSATSGHFTIGGSTNDLVAPVVESVTVTPSTVARGGSITVSAHVTDATGVQGVAFQARRANAAPGWCAGNAALVSGTATDGVWERTCVVPANATVGNYTTGTVVADLLNNLGGVGDGVVGPTAGAFTVN
jgi:hypothetical protein